MNKFDSPATSTSVSPPSGVNGTAVAEVPGLMGKTPSLINPDSRCDDLGTPHPCAVEGPAEVYVKPVNIEPAVHGAGHGTMDGPATGNPIKHG